MALDRFINNVRTEVAKRYDLKTGAEINAFFIGMEESAKDNQEALEKRDKMLRDTVAELCEAKRLLKAAMEDMKILYETGTDEGCIGIKFKWRYADEALKLLGDESNGI